jgi:hypothetical protein
MSPAAHTHPTAESVLLPEPCVPARFPGLSRPAPCPPQVHECLLEPVLQLLRRAGGYSSVAVNAADPAIGPGMWMVHATRRGGGAGEDGAAREA